MVSSKLRDIEVCVENGTLKIIPYKLKLVYRDGGVNFETDTSTTGQGEIFECDISDKANQKLVGYVLGLEDSEDISSDWNGHSDWNTTEYLKRPDTPAKIKLWLLNLPLYNLQEVRIG